MSCREPVRGRRTQRPVSSGRRRAREKRIRTSYRNLGRVLSRRRPCSTALPTKRRASVSAVPTKRRASVSAVPTYRRASRYMRVCCSRWRRASLGRLLFVSICVGRRMLFISLHVSPLYYKLLLVLWQRHPLTCGCGLYGLLRNHIIEGEQIRITYYIYE